MRKTIEYLNKEILDDNDGNPPYDDWEPDSLDDRPEAADVESLMQALKEAGISETPHLTNYVENYLPSYSIEFRAISWFPVDAYSQVLEENESYGTHLRCGFLPVAQGSSEAIFLDVHTGRVYALEEWEFRDVYSIHKKTSGGDVEAIDWMEVSNKLKGMKAGDPGSGFSEVFESFDALDAHVLASLEECNDIGIAGCLGD